MDESQQHSTAAASPDLKVSGEISRRGGEGDVMRGETDEPKTEPRNQTES